MQEVQAVSYRDLAKAARDASRVSSLTHDLYKYPARFSPTFVRSAIKTFTRPGDWVVDPFVGGGTTLIESLASGRNAIGSDVSSLSKFVCDAKTTILSDKDFETIENWLQRVGDVINMQSRGYRSPQYSDAGYYRNISGPEEWRLKKAIEQSLHSISCLQSEKAQIVARCILLRTSQWALDARKYRPSLQDFREGLFVRGQRLLESSRELKEQAELNAEGQLPKIYCLNTPASELSRKALLQRTSPKLILTSPPYPGIRVLYHRWQVDGRKTTPAPFWISKKLDGAGEQFYTMGGIGKTERIADRYFQNLFINFSSIAKIANKKTTIVQVVAFSQPNQQLSRYLEVMEACGLREMHPWDEKDADKKGRVWRTVPNRRWHTHTKAPTSGSREVVLIHKKA